MQLFATGCSRELWIKELRRCRDDASRESLFSVLCGGLSLWIRVLSLGERWSHGLWVNGPGAFQFGSVDTSVEGIWADSISVWDCGAQDSISV